MCLERKSSGLLAKKQEKGFQNFNLSVQGNVSRKTFSKNHHFLVVLVLWAEHFKIISIKFTAWFPKPHSTRPGKHFGEKWKNDGSLVIYYFQRKIIELLPKNSRQVFQNFNVRSTCPEKILRETFSENQDFLVVLVNWAENSRTFGKSFKAGF